MIDLGRETSGSNEFVSVFVFALCLKLYDLFALSTVPGTVVTHFLHFTRSFIIIIFLSFIDSDVF